MLRALVVAGGLLTALVAGAFALQALALGRPSARELQFVHTLRALDLDHACPRHELRLISSELARGMAVHFDRCDSLSRLALDSR